MTHDPRAMNGKRRVKLPPVSKESTVAGMCVFQCVFHFHMSAILRQGGSSTRVRRFCFGQIIIYMMEKNIICNEKGDCFLIFSDLESGNLEHDFQNTKMIPCNF